MNTQTLKQLDTPEATEVFISTAKILISENIEEVSRSLSSVPLNNKKYNLTITVSAYEIKD